MLVLSRKNCQSVRVGGSAGFEQVLTVTVLEIRSQSVRLGFEVATDVPVHRLEVWERIAAGISRDSPDGDAAKPAPE